MYYITPINSNTGSKFKSLMKRMEEVFNAQKAVAEKYGFSKWRPDHFSLKGGITSVMFETPPDKKIWKYVGENEYNPNLRSKEGKLIKKEFEELPLISFQELNQCISTDLEFGSHIGYNFNNPNYIGIQVEEGWSIPMPSDCEEITTTRYKELFENKKDGAGN